LSFCASDVAAAKWWLGKLVFCTSQMTGWEDRFRNDLCWVGRYTPLFLYQFAVQCTKHILFVLLFRAVYIQTSTLWYSASLHL